MPKNKHRLFISLCDIFLKIKLFLHIWFDHNIVSYLLYKSSIDLAIILQENVAVKLTNIKTSKMPVLSPHRSASSNLSGSYRSTFSSSGLDRPFYSSSYSPRITSYSERYTSRSYIDSDGRRVFSR